MLHNLTMLVGTAEYAGFCEKPKKMSSMTFCSVSLIALFVAVLGIFIFRKPSKAELNKFEKEDQERFNWSKMGF